MARRKVETIGGDIDGNIVVSPEHYSHLRNCEQVLRNLLHELKYTPDVVKTDGWRCEFARKLEAFLKEND